MCGGLMSRDENFPQIKRDLVDRIQVAILKIDEMHHDVKEHEKIINGDPLTKTRGVVERLNAIEDSHGNREKWTMAIGASVIAIMVKNVIEFFNHPK
jgi:hypothetical protein